ncbi:MAG: AEC family transporter [Sporolactobacillus sp.]|uniref:AEC family transporter n=1 Tax=Sporolactobacillus sp. STSJ-5 TaxID=2965076 RepID=UPI002104D146|nr:AEC family transporter [Sporolactobacillus sp. STSJ-5]MCQ2011583.1 AEC family transporter [Sporolactobacillus sp. STSJ-5]
MTAYINLLTSISVPILIICVCGAILQKKRNSVDTKLLADISLYILAPALILNALSESHLKGTNVIHIFLFSVIMTAVLWLVAMLTAKLFRFPEPSARALTLTVVFSNANNYGLPVLLLAFGQTGFSLGAVYVIGQIILVNILGMYIASRAAMSGKQSILHILKSPLIYACLVGALLAVTHLHLPIGTATAVQMLGTAYPVLVLLILGVKLGSTKFSGVWRREVWIGVFLRLLIVPIIAKLVLFSLGIHGMLASVLFVEISMPAAVNSVMLIEKFDGDSELASLIVTITTILSFIYLPFLIYIG